MSLIRRILARAKREAKGRIDMRLNGAIRSRPRPPRSPASLDDLPKQSALIVVAHPDDEVIAAGALLGRLPRAGIVCVTDGAPRRGNYARQAGFSNWPDYAHARRREAESALAPLEREIAPMQNLGIADQEATLELVDVTRCLAEKLRSGFSHVIAHAYEGGHPDHDAAAFCVHAACVLIAKDGGTAPVIVEAPLYNAPDGTYIYRRFLQHADAGPAVSFGLSPAEQDLKRRMFECHVTQQAVLKAFSLDEEMFRVAPRYHFSAPPHAGDVGYNQFGWWVTGKIWRAYAWRAMRELGVLEELA